MAENYYYSTLTGAELDAALKQVPQAADHAQTAQSAAAQAVKIAAELDSHCAPPIVAQAQGAAVSLPDSAARPLQGLSIFGKTTQSGTPAPDAPAAPESAGAGGSITVTCGFTPNYTRAVISTPNGLPGIPVDEGGSYTDASSQQWIADEIDFARGVYVQRVGSYTVTADAVGTQFQDGCVQLINPTDFLYQKGTPMLCDRFVNNREAYCDGISTAARYLSDGEFSNRYWETSTARFLYFKSSLFTDLATAKAWFAANETVVLYPLAEPVETALTEEEMAAYHGLRTAYPAAIVKNDAGAYMHIKYVADTKRYIDSKFAALSAAIVQEE